MREERSHRQPFLIGFCFRAVLIVLAVLALLTVMAWGSAALWFDGPSVRWVAGILAAGFCLGCLIILLRIRPYGRAIVVVLAVFGALLGWWLQIPPSNDLNWQPDVATLAWVDIAGDKVTIHNIRNIDYRTETDFTVHHYDKTFDLSQLKGVDFFLVYWGSPNIAHTMMSFDFEGQGNVCFSIETRKEKGEDYSTVKGFFRQYEIIYVVADERDLVRLRTNYREQGKGEDVYLYRLNASPELARKVFFSYLKEVNRLKEHPQLVQTP